MKRVINLPKHEFSAELCVTSGQAFRWFKRGNALTGVIGDAIVLIEQSDDRTYCSTSPDGRHAEVERYFRADVNLSEVHNTLIKTTPYLEQYINCFRGLRLLRWNDPYECLFSFLCTANNNIPRIIGMISRLCDSFGEPLAEFEGIKLNRFPSAEVIARIDVSELRCLGFGFRARTLTNAAQALLDRGRDWLQELKSADYPSAHKELMRLPAVGPKVADCICLFGLDKMEAVPIDTHLWQAVGKLIMPEYQGLALTPQRYAQAGDYFRSTYQEYAGWAHQYLFYAHLKGIIN